MREITSHQTSGNELNMQLRVTAQDEPGPGGANHNYRITSYGQDDGFPGSTQVNFQNGPVKEVGLTGVSNEAILALVIDRLEGFQRGQFSCRENAIALTKCQEAMHWMLHRTRERMARGVEGTMQK